MARVKTEYQQILYEVEVMNELNKYGHTREEIQMILAINDERFEIIQEILRKRGDEETKEVLSRRVFDEMYK